MLTLKWIMGDREALTDTKAVRKKVFVDEMGLSAEDEDDGVDASCIHLVAYEDSLPISTGRVMITNDDFILSRIATVKERRNEGLATGIVEALVEACVQMGGNRQILTASAESKGFFEKIGFKQYGEDSPNNEKPYPVGTTANHRQHEKSENIHEYYMEHFGGMRKCGGCGKCA